MLPDVLTLFDAADPNGVTAVRNETTVASQSLFLLNNPFVREQARSFAASTVIELTWCARRTDDQRITLPHFVALGRQPTSEELTEARDFIAAYLATHASEARPEVDRRLSAWQSYCQSLLCSKTSSYT